MVYRIDGATFARQQAQWFVVGLVLFAGDDDRLPGLPQARELPLPDRDRLARAVGPAAGPGLSPPVNGAYLDDSPRLDHVPADRVRQGRAGDLPGQLPARSPPGARRAGARSSGTGSRRSSTWDRCCCCGGSAMVILVLLHDIGSSLMFYGGLLAILYVATDRISFVLVGVVAFGRRRLVPRDAHPAHRLARRRLAAPVQLEANYNAVGRQLPARQRASSRWPRAACSARASARRLLTVPGTTIRWHPGCRHGHDLRGHHRRARPVRCARRC